MKNQTKKSGGAWVILFNKPYGVHSQFRREQADMLTLADFFSDASLRVAGRLDKDSEGLLVLTDHGGLNHVITTPPTALNRNTQAVKLTKTYLVQVENTPTEAQLQALRTGVMLKDGKTLPAIVEQLVEGELPITLWQRHPPIRERANIPTAWLAISINEGKNRQVRRMVAHVGLPCLRLIRYRVGEWSLLTDGAHAETLAVGQWRKLYLSADTLTAMGVRADADLPKDNRQHRTAKRVGRVIGKPVGRTKPSKKPLVKTAAKASG